MIKKILVFGILVLLFCNFVSAVPLTEEERILNNQEIADKLERDSKTKVNQSEIIFQDKDLTITTNDLIKNPFLWGVVILVVGFFIYLWLKETSGSGI